MEAKQIFTGRISLAMRIIYGLIIAGIFSPVLLAIFLSLFRTVENGSGLGTILSFALFFTVPVGFVVLVVTAIIHVIFRATFKKRNRSHNIVQKTKKILGETEGTASTKMVRVGTIVLAVFSVLIIVIYGLILLLKVVPV